jgi:Fur family ferric uptake transcriptional regulator
MDSIEDAIRIVGGRVTKTRKTIVEIIAGADCLLARTDLVKSLSRRGLRPDRSTIYRELQFLTKHRFVRECVIDGVVYYEIQRDSHGHLICMGCRSIRQMPAKYFEDAKRRIHRGEAFHVTDQSLNVYGYCNKCRESECV